MSLLDLKQGEKQVKKKNTELFIYHQCTASVDFLLTLSSTANLQS